MSRLARYTQQIFGSTATAGQMAEFGSLAAGTPQTYSGSSITPTIVQSLANYLSGWFGAVIGANSPAIEDMNALFYLITYQLSYLFQAGVAEYDAGTTYYIGDLVNDGNGFIYQSIANANIGNALFNPTYWQAQNGGYSAQSSTYSIAMTDSFVAGSASGGAFTMTLPGIATVPIGKRYTFKKVDSSTNAVTVKGNSSDAIDGSNTFILTGQYQYLSIQSNGAVWEIVGKSRGAIQVSSASGAFTTTSTTGVAVTNLSVSVAANGGPISVSLAAGSIGASSTGDFADAAFQIYRGATLICTVAVASTVTSGSVTATSLPASALSFIDFPGPGTFTYTIQASVAAATNSTASISSSLVAYELI